MRRRPQEDNEEQNERLEPNVSGCRCPADHRRKRTGGAADDDVLWRISLQPHRIHDDVEENREGEQRGGFDIEGESKDHDCAARKNKSECKRLGARDPAARDRTPGRASHHRIDVGVVPHVEHAGGASSGGDGKDCNGPKQRIQVTRRNHQANERGEHRKQHHARLHERDEIGQTRGQAGPRRQLRARDGNRCGVHDENPACQLLSRIDVVRSRSSHDPPNGDRVLRRRGMREPAGQWASGRQCSRARVPSSGGQQPERGLTKAAKPT